MGCPAQALHWEGEVFRLDIRPDWLDVIPDLDAMRDVYRALTALYRRGTPCRNLQMLAHAVAVQSGKGPLTALLSLLTLEDMGLFAFDLSASPVGVRRLDRKRAEPGDSAVWRMIQSWRS